MPKSYRGMAADVRALTAYVKLLRAGEDVLREASLVLSLYDLTPDQFGVLETLFQSGPRQISDLGRGISGASGDLAAVVETLRKRRLVRRGVGSGNRRTAPVALTPKGRNLVRSVLPGHGAAIVSVMSRLSPREQETLGVLCRKLGRSSPSLEAKSEGRLRRNKRLTRKS